MGLTGGSQPIFPKQLRFDLVTYEAPINKYAQTTPFTDAFSSFFQILNDFFK
jgi:hypothetical protein